MKYSIPKRENELRASGPSPVIVTQLTPEELAEVRRKYPANNKDKSFQKPIEIKPRPKGEEDMPRGRKKAESTLPLREKAVTEQKSVSQELLDKAIEEIERLMAQLQTADTEIKRLTMAVIETENERDSFRTELAEAREARLEYKRMFEGSYELGQNQIAKISEHLNRIKDLEAERDGLITEVNQLTDRVMELEEDVYRADVATRPTAESNVELLNSAIADLTRVRRIVQSWRRGNSLWVACIIQLSS
ncbi:hypothetical protein [Paenibacillus massiliensis]|uniref:hypothetical protein n=1 Tax=Paenibacillus massiliensis TaxID=225917 RepID=UPI00040B0F6E|nr:hypothetical protein [Paenibacillus massiliensis]